MLDSSSLVSGTWFRAENTMRTKEDAKTYCHSIGGHLAMPLVRLVKHYYSIA